MAKRKLSTSKKIIFVGLVLIVVQAFVLMILRRAEPRSAMEAIDNEVSKLSGAGHGRKEEIRVQLAIQDFRSKNDGEPPKSLQELVPTYFSTVPIDPATGKPFEYRVDRGRPFVGSSVDDDKVASKQQDTRTARKADELTDEEQQVLIASLSDDSEESAFVYDPVGKRDPFRPFNLMRKPEHDENKTELERYDLGQLKVTAILTFGDTPKAIVENSAGRGFTVHKGTKIGPNEGEVVEIFENRIVILETSTDFTGETRTETIEMHLRTKDQEEISRGIRR